VAISTKSSAGYASNPGKPMILSVFVLRSGVKKILAKGREEFRHLDTAQLVIIITYEFSVN